MERFSSIVSRVLFIAAFILAGIAVLEKFANLLGYTVISVYYPWRLLEFAVVVLLFVIGRQLREIKVIIRAARSNL